MKKKKQYLFILQKNKQLKVNFIRIYKKLRQKIFKKDIILQICITVLKMFAKMSFFLKIIIFLKNTGQQLLKNAKKVLTAVPNMFWVKPNKVTRIRILCPVA